jgi:hypothetical protein
MTSSAGAESFAPNRGWRAALTDGGTLGFALRLVLLLLALWLTTGLLGWILPAGDVRRYGVPLAGALVVAGAYLRRPGEALFGLALFVMFYETTAWYLGSGVKRIDELSILFLVPIVAWRELPRWRAWVSWPREAAIALAAVMGVVSSLVAGVPIGVWVPALLLLGKPIAFFYVAMLSRVDPEEASGGLWVVVGAAIVVGLFGLVELFDAAAFQDALNMNEYVRLRSENVVVKSLFVHPALFGYFMTFASLLLLARYLVTRRLRWLVLSLLVATGPFLSARRRAILALAAGAFAALVASPRLFRSWAELVRTWIPAAVGGAVLVVLFLSLLTGLYTLTWQRYINEPSALPSASPGLPGIEEPIGEGENRRARTALYDGSLRIASDYFPLGGGLGRYASWMSREEYSPLYEEYGISTIRGLRRDNPSAATDTFWPQILGELGVVGFAGYAAFMALLGWMLWREAGRDAGTELRILRLAAGMIFAQALVESAASAMYHSPSRVYLFYLVVGLVASLAWRRPRDAPG